jgi:hypothetical protein
MIRLIVMCVRGLVGVGGSIIKFDETGKVIYTIYMRFAFFNFCYFLKVFEILYEG